MLTYLVHQNQLLLMEGSEEFLFVLLKETIDVHGTKNYMQNYIWIFSIQIFHSIFWVQLATSELE